MATIQQRRVSFDDRDTRSDEMHRTIETWLSELVDATAEARASEAFTEWLDIQSRFHDYSYRNTLLIARQCPEATRVAGYKTWQTEVERQVREGERAIWIWAPIVARRCPECRNSKSYHEQHGCEYDETPSEEWSRGPVGFKPVPVFDVSQTGGEPLPELDTAATGDAEALVRRVEHAAEAVNCTLEFIPAADWPYGNAQGIFQRPDRETDQATVAVIANLDDAERASTIVHEYAHALLHGEGEGDREQREVEAEAVAYVVGRHYGLDVDGSALYLAAWSDDPVSAIEGRLGRIAAVARTLIDAIYVD